MRTLGNRPDIITVDDKEECYLSWLENNKDADKKKINDVLRQLRELRLINYLNSIKQENKQ